MAIRNYTEYIGKWTAKMRSRNLLKPEKNTMKQKNIKVKVSCYEDFQTQHIESILCVSV